MQQFKEVTPMFVFLSSPCRSAESHLTITINSQNVIILISNKVYPKNVFHSALYNE